MAVASVLSWSTAIWSAFRAFAKSPCATATWARLITSTRPITPAESFAGLASSNLATIPKLSL